MALWNRKKKTDAVDMPPELQSYYNAENREKTWMAWVLGLVTLVVTILLALALFYGGRWSYRKIRNDEPTKVTTVQTEQKTDESPTAGQPVTPTPPASDQAPSTATSSTSTTTPSGATVSTGDSGLTNTGPTDTLAIFVAVSVLAYAAHRRYLTHNA